MFKIKLIEFLAHSKFVGCQFTVKFEKIDNSYKHHLIFKWHISPLFSLSVVMSLYSGRMWMQVGPKIHRLKFGTLEC